MMVQAAVSVMFGTAAYAVWRRWLFPPIENWTWPVKPNLETYGYGLLVGLLAAVLGLVPGWSSTITTTAGLAGYGLAALASKLLRKQQPGEVL